MHKNLLLLTVVESNKASKTDDVYFRYILQTYFGEHLYREKEPYLQDAYLYMDGKTNYRKVFREIQNARKAYRHGRVEVLYCFDTDKKGTEEKKFIQKVDAYCRDNGFSYCLSCPEIEAVMDVPSSLGKVEGSRWFSAHRPSGRALQKDRFFASNTMEGIAPRTTSYGTMVQALIDSA